MILAQEANIYQSIALYMTAAPALLIFLAFIFSPLYYAWKEKKKKAFLIILTVYTYVATIIALLFIGAE